MQQGQWPHPDGSFLSSGFEERQRLGAALAHSPSNMLPAHRAVR